MDADALVYQLGLSRHVLDLNTRDLSHEESLLRPDPGGSCLNWVVGHLTRTRNLALATLGQQPLYPMEVGSQLSTFVFHESYHVGQTGGSAGWRTSRE